MYYLFRKEIYPISSHSLFILYIVRLLKYYIVCIPCKKMQVMNAIATQWRTLCISHCEVFYNKFVSA